MKIPLSPEAEERLVRFRASEREHRAMGDRELAERAEQVFGNCAFPHSRWMLRGQPVYDSVMWHVIVPEMIRRMKA